jgi:DnaJ-class molecular chaperone
MPMQDYYGVLGIAPTATAVEIKQVYRRLARAFHPDRNAGAGAEARFKEIAEAYAVLGDECQRSAYDLLHRDGLHTDGAMPEGFDQAAFEALFGRIFGSGAPARAGEDVYFELELTLEEAHRGGRRRLRIPQPAGRGDDPRAGELRTRWVTLPPCRNPDARIRLHDPHGGGDLLIAVKLRPHPQFAWRGGQLEHELIVTPWDAALGARAIVPTLDGRVALQLPANSRNGSRLRLAGRGLAGGDLIVVLKVDNPEVQTPAQREAYLHLRRQFG